jgi:thioredoxin 1
MGSVQAVGAAQWDAEVLKSPGVVMIDFWAVWCGPCKMIAPTIEDLSNEYAGRLKVFKLNTDEDQEIASRYQIMGIPTLMFVKDGQVVDKIVGAATKKQIKDRIDALL